MQGIKIGIIIYLFNEESELKYLKIPIFNIPIKVLVYISCPKFFATDTSRPKPTKYTTILGIELMDVNPDSMNILVLKRKVSHFQQFRGFNYSIQGRGKLICCRIYYNPSFDVKTIKIHDQCMNNSTFSLVNI